MLFHEELFTRSQCTYCQQEIQSLGVECVECHNGNFRLCVECFSVGAEIGQHKSDHKYRFFDSGSLVLSSTPSSFAPENDPPNAATAPDEVIPSEPTPGPSSSVGTTNGNASAANTVGSPKWSAREEIRLLDAIEQYGFGNWQDISKHIESKTPAEAKSHYVNRYVNGTLGQLTWATDVTTEVNRDICTTQIQKPIDHTIPGDDGPLSPTMTQRLPPLEITSDEMVQLGYMPQRDDYEKEFDNEAEKLVSQLSFSPEDDELDIGLKLALVDIYTRRLRERARRKRMIRDYQLVSKFFKKDKAKGNGTAGESSGAKGQFSAYEKMLQEKLRPFAQFMNSKEHDNLIRNLVKEKELKFRLMELYKYRRAGIKRPEECAEYERFLANQAAKRSLETIPEEEQDEGRSCKKVPPPAPPVAENLVAPLLVRQLQQTIPPSSPKTIASLSSVGSDENGGGSPSVGQNLIPPLFSSEDSSLRSYMESSESVHALLQQGLLEDPRGMEVETLLLTNEISSQPSEKQKASADQYTAEYAPSSDLLTEKELQFCLKTTITPAQFLTIKTALLLARKPKIDNNQQVMELKDIPCPPNLTLNEWEQVITFFKTNYI